MEEEEEEEWGEEEGGGKLTQICVGQVVLIPGGESLLWMFSQLRRFTHGHTSPMVTSIMKNGPDSGGPTRPQRSELTFTTTSLPGRYP